MDLEETGVTDLRTLPVLTSHQKIKYWETIYEILELEPKSVSMASRAFVMERQVKCERGVVQRAA